MPSSGGLKVMDSVPYTAARESAQPVGPPDQVPALASKTTSAAEEPPWSETLLSTMVIVAEPATAVACVTRVSFSDQGRARAQ
jgi:hypothetical protein